MASESKTCGNCSTVYKSDQDFLKDTHSWRVCQERNLWFSCNCGSTLMLPKGEYDWYAPESQMSAPAQSLFNQLALTEKFPYIETSTMELIQAVNNSSVSIKQLADQLKNNPLLAEELLVFASNSKSHREGDRERIDSIQHAINYVGRKQLGNILVMASLRTIKLSTKAFSAQQFWEHSTLVGFASELLNKETKLELEPDMVYLSGCLIDIGSIMMAYFDPKLADSIFTYIDNLQTQCSWQDAEEKFHAPKHTLLGEIAATLWGLPRYISESCRFHHNDFLPPTLLFPDLVRIVSLADILSLWINMKPHQFENENLQFLQKSLNLTDEQIKTICEKLKKSSAA